MEEAAPTDIADDEAASGPHVRQQHQSLKNGHTSLVMHSSTVQHTYQTFFFLLFSFLYFSSDN